MEIAKYYVLSDDDAPFRLCSTWEDAIQHKASYIDAFNDEGEFVTSFTLFNNEYTDKGW